ncbi:MAG: molecular chaperone Hsp33 [Rhodobacterales bacterium]|nr:MAG: molecular chaperone Hsp33 [Rhodobacterales bacterium]
MSLGSKIAWDDTVLPFQLDRSDIRGRVVRLDGALDEILSQHAYPPAIERLVAEAALLTALIGPTIKLRWKLSLQIRGDGPARLIATDYFAPEAEGQPGRIRAYAGFDAERLDAQADPFPQIGRGYFAILIDQGRNTTPYSGLTPIAGHTLADCAQTYFAQSEQLPTRFALSFDRIDGAWRAGGVMLQKMPALPPRVAKNPDTTGQVLLSASDLLPDPEALENWKRANILLESVQADELIGPHIQPTQMLVRLFHEDQPRVFDPHPVQFGCSCSADRVRQSLSIYSQKDIARMTTDEGIVTADCQFCGAHYTFDPKTLGFEAGEASDDHG